MLWPLDARPEQVPLTVEPESAQSICSTVNTQSTYSQHADNMQSTRQSTIAQNVDFSYVFLTKYDTRRPPARTRPIIIYKHYIFLATGTPRAAFS